jgi:acyl transferase domain-containing protein/acyl carrier protein
MTDQLGRQQTITRTVAEEAVRQIWAQVLALEFAEIGSAANFFALGGDSALVMQVMEQVNARFFGKNEESGLPLTDFYACASVGELASRIVARAPARPAPAPVPRGLPNESVAIIGMACRLPGAPNIGAFWENIREGRECIRHFSDQELRAAGISAEKLAAPNYVRCSGLVEDIELFDADYFELTPKEAALLCPEQRLLLECAVQALEDAGHGGRGQRVGTFVSAGTSVYLIDHLARQFDFSESSEGMAIAVASTSPATRISFALDLTGPSVTVDTACSSSLVAVHQACAALLRGECDMAIAGGASVRTFGPRGYLAEEGGILSPTGHCRPFDACADGTVITSGAGVVVLKRLEDARKDRDDIYAVILGSAINNDGCQKIGYTAPSAAGQATVIRDAQERAGVKAEDIQYIEAHGTGTKAGDVIEIAALKEVFSAPGSAAHQVIAIGGVKANVGHLEAAAGVVGLMKTALALKHGYIPPATTPSHPNPELRLNGTPLFLNRELTPWRTDGGRRRAGVSSFGIGGTNAHAVLEEAPPMVAAPARRPCQLLVISARSELALEALCEATADYLEKCSQTDLSAVAYTLQTGRAMNPFRQFVVCETGIEGAELLRRACRARRTVDRAHTAGSVRIVFACTASTRGEIQIPRPLYELVPCFRDCIDECAKLTKERLGVDLRQLGNDPVRNGVLPKVQPSLLRRVAMFAVDYALGTVLRQSGIEPSIVCGSEAGRYAVSCLSGAMSLQHVLDALMNSGEEAETRPSQTGSDPPQDPSRAGGPRLVVKLTSDADTGEVDTQAPRPEEDRLIGPILNPGYTHGAYGGLLQALGQLWQFGVPVRFSNVVDPGARRRNGIPAYSFDRKRHWIDPVRFSKGAEAERRGKLPFDEWFQVPTWQRRVRDVSERSAARLAPDACYIVFDDGEQACRMIAESLVARGLRTIRVRRGGCGGHNDASHTIDARNASSYRELLEHVKTTVAGGISIIYGWGLAACRDGMTAELEQSVDELSDLLHLCQALSDEQGAGKALKLVVLTTDAHRVSGAERCRPGSAMLSAVCGVIAAELPELSCQSVDLASVDVGSQGFGGSVERLVTEISNEIESTFVAFRSGMRWVRTVESVKLPPADRADSLLRRNGTYLITGGLGGIGLLIAKHLARSCHANLILLSRREFPARKDWQGWLRTRDADDRTSRTIDEILKIEAFGARVQLIRADVTDAGRIREIVNTIGERFGVLNGVFHCAGVPSGGVIALKSRASLEATMAPKTLGTSVLYEAVQNVGLDFFLCSSSVAAIVGVPGQYDYTAANAFQDGFAHRHDSLSGPRVICVNWGGWKGVGMAEHAKLAGRSETESLGFAPEEGIAALERVLANPQPQWIVNDEVLRPIRLRAPKESSVSHVAGLRSHHSETPRQIQTPRERPGAVLEEQLQEIWRDLLGVQEVGVVDDFFALGGDSLLAVQLSTRVRSSFRATLPMKRFLERPTISAMADLLTESVTQRAVSSGT